jgi:diaminopimelate epimerase
MKPTQIEFTKMHGIGNDYIYIDCTRSQLEHLEQLSIEMSNRHCGVGGDGIILILPSDVADFKMRIFNADGSEAKMCGNGSRCVGKYVYDHKLTTKTQITLETLAGIKVLELHLGSDGLVESVTVDMGAPSLDVKAIPVEYAGGNMVDAIVATSYGDVKLTAVSMGNPHGVVFVDNLDSIDVGGLGRELETHPMWPDRANIEFAQVLSPDVIRMRVWERGSGETLACGTGACATAVAGAITKRSGSDVTLKLLGGDLKIHWDGADGHVFMTGPATEVFSGTYATMLI